MSSKQHSTGTSQEGGRQSTPKKNQQPSYHQNDPNCSPRPSGPEQEKCVCIRDHSSPSQRPQTVLVFGETLVGKSSLINMLAGKEVCETSNESVACTTENNCHCIEVASHSIHAYDTIGLNQSLQGTVPGPRAVAMLFKLIRDLAHSDGIDFLVMVVKAEPIKERMVKNYELVFKYLCMEQVPIVIVVTGLEHETDMKDWWGRNEARFHDYGMRFTCDDCACVVTSKGKQTETGFSLQTEYDLSKKTLCDLISSRCRSDPGWKPDAGIWFHSTSSKRSLKEIVISLFTHTPQTQMRKALIEHAELQENQAEAIAQWIAPCLTW